MGIGLIILIIVVGLILAASIAWAILEGDEYIVRTGAIVALVVAVVGWSGMWLFGPSATTPKPNLDKTYSLQAINTASTVEGEFFLGSGYIDGKRVINYIYKAKDSTGTYSKVESANASKARIYEDSKTPYVIIHHHAHAEYSVWLGKGIGSGWHDPDTYEFHVPAHSIVENYKIGNN